MKSVFKKSFLVVLLLMGNLQAAQAGPIEIETVLSTTQGWDQSRLPPSLLDKPEIRVLKFTIEPGAKTPVHLHPVNGGGYITSGELTMYSTTDPHGDFSDPDKVKEIVLKQGEAWAETVNVWHYGVNNTDKNVEFIVIFAAQEGVPSAMSLGAY